MVGMVGVPHPYEFTGGYGGEKTESHYFLVIFRVKIALSGLSGKCGGTLYLLLEGARNIICKARATDDGRSRQVAPKPLLRQLKWRPLRPQRSLWRNSLENLSAGRDINVAACHMFSKKRSSI